jgi:hypothetical protein
MAPFPLAAAYLLRPTAALRDRAGLYNRALMWDLRRKARCEKRDMTLRLVDEMTSPAGCR